MKFASLLATVALFAPLAFAASGAREASAPLQHADGGYSPHALGTVGIRDGTDFQRFTVTVAEAGDQVTLTAQISDGTDHFVDVGALSATSAGWMYNVVTSNGGVLPLGATNTSELSGRAVRVVDGDGHPILVGTVPTYDAGGGGDTPPTAPITARADLVRADGADASDAHGVIVVIERGTSESFRCEVGGLAPSTGFLLYVGDHDSAVLSGDFTTTDGGNALMVRDTADGASLPDGAASLADLAGKHVEIRDHEGHVLLLGAVPRVESAHDVTPVHEGDVIHDQTSGAEVHVVVDIHPHEGHEHIDLDMTHLPTGDVHKAKGPRPTADLFVADATGALQPAGSATINRRGKASLHYATRHGGKLPLGAATLRELSGHAFEVRVGGVRVVGGSLPSF